MDVLPDDTREAAPVYLLFTEQLRSGTGLQERIEQFQAA
jgi:hypothetical protein